MEIQMLTVQGQLIYSQLCHIVLSVDQLSQQFDFVLYMVEKELIKILMKLRSHLVDPFPLFLKIESILSPEPLISFSISFRLKRWKNLL